MDGQNKTGLPWEGKPRKITTYPAKLNAADCG